MKKMLTRFAAACVFAAVSASTIAADTFVIDNHDNGMHAFVQFRVKHLGYSWLYGNFKNFDGEFVYDAADDSKNTVNVTVDMSSLDTLHTERDKHLRSDEFLDVKKFPESTFVSTKFETVGENKAKMTGNLTLLGVTKEVTLDVDVIGGGKDPWGGYRQGFEGRTTINAQDFGVPTPWVQDVELVWSVEGIKK